jgi:hypothetical protein
MFTIRTTCRAQLFLPVLIFGESTYYSVAYQFLSLQSKYALQQPVLKNLKYVIHLMTEATFHSKQAKSYFVHLIFTFSCSRPVEPNGVASIP